MTGLHLILLLNVSWIDPRRSPGRDEPSPVEVDRATFGRWCWAKLGRANRDSRTLARSLAVSGALTRLLSLNVAVAVAVVNGAINTSFRAKGEGDKKKSLYVM